MSNPSVAYWDSCLFIDRIEAIHPDRLPVLRAMTDAAEAGALKIITSTLTMAEVVKLNGLSAAHDEKEQMIVSFFDNDYLHVRNVDPEISKIARRVIRNHVRLKPLDALHVATALFYEVDVLFTYDDKHLTPLNDLIPFPHDPSKTLKIENPTWEWQPTLAVAPGQSN
jgi:predicted nucleic acid-binding protein